MRIDTPASVLPELPLFPLGSVLFPGARLPLRVFEVRYLDMVAKAHKAGQPFGVVCLTQGAEVRVAGAADEQFADVGTLARIETLAAPQAGLLQIECTGIKRFRVQSRQRRKNGLWTAAVELLPGDVDMPVPPDLDYIAVALRRVIETLQARQDADPEPGNRLPFVAPWRFDDCGWVANRWCDLLPVPPELKQRLMQLDSPLMRLELVGDVLARTGIA